MLRQLKLGLARRELVEISHTHARTHTALRWVPTASGVLYRVISNVVKSETRPPQALSFTAAVANCADQPPDDQSRQLISTAAA